MKFEVKSHLNYEEMSLPNGWEITDFEKSKSNERFRIGKIKKQEYKKVGKYPVIDQSQDYIAGYTDEEDKVYNGELPVVIFGDHTRIFKFIDFPFVCGADGVKVLPPNKSKFYPLFLFFSLLSLEIPSRGYNRHYHLLKEKKIPLPPLTEQQKIASILIAIENTRQKTERVINATKKLKKSMMKYLFTYGPVPLSERKHVKLKKTEIGMIPEEWEETRIKDHCQIITGGTPNTKIMEYWAPPEIPWMKSGEVNKYKIKEINNYISKKGLENSNARWLPKKSVVIALAGRGKTRGTTAMLEVESTCNQSVVSMFPDKELYYQYLHYYLTFLYPYIRRLTGDKDRSGLNKQIVGNIPLFYPPYSKQKNIAESLLTIDYKIEEEGNKLKALEELFNSMLNNLMSGRIRADDLKIEIKNISEENVR